jgi:hypothetical protein
MSQANKKGAGARGKKAGGKGPADDKGEDVLQAVVSFPRPMRLTMAAAKLPAMQANRY